jgi:hypothetical protein
VNERLVLASWLLWKAVSDALNMRPRTSVRIGDFAQAPLAAPHRLRFGHSADAMRGAHAQRVPCRLLSPHHRDGLGFADWS